MRKKLYCVWVTVSFLLSAAAANAQGFGVCGYDKQTIDSANCYGPASLKATTVTGAVHVAGPLKAYNANVASIDVAGVAELYDTIVKNKSSVAGMLTAFQSKLTAVQVAGNAKLTKTSVSGSAKIQGSLTATDSDFANDVVLYSDKLDLVSSTVKGDLIIASKHKNPVVTLTCGSHIEGKVIFTEKAGTVKMTADSVIKGKIINGTTEVIKVSCK
ncbi:MAG: hypothetical protein ACD_45C00709G0001 [uncultured bacterium]|nr:MAG: hypothetical protein ACD_45C00709G0001 [uncultured bacterium]